MPTLRELFDALTLPDRTLGPPHFSAQPVPGHEAHRVAKDADGSPCLLLYVSPTRSAVSPPPTLLSHLAVQYDVRCRVSRPDQPSEESIFTLIRCLSSEPILMAKFLDVMEVVVRAIGGTPTADRVRRAIGDLVELFRSLERPPLKSVRGVWAELFVIANSHDPRRLAPAWHATPGEAFDFSEGGDRIEVKAVAGSSRAHYFSLDQIYPPREARVLIVSLFVEALAGGTAIKNLLDTVRRRLALYPELALRIETLIAHGLGKSWAPAMEESFDWQRAVDSIQFLEPHAIPAVPRELPREVTEVRFRSDISASASLNVDDARQMGGLFEAL